MDATRPDILILGAGILGSATAWQLAKQGVNSVTVIDLDLAGTYSSSELNAGGCRATWWNPLNMELASHSLKFYQTIADEIQFSQKGYLFLYNSTQWKTALQKKSEYESKKIPVQYLTVTDIPKRLPEFENLKGIAGATFSPQDGLLDPHLLKEYYRQQAKALGVQFLDRHFITGCTVANQSITQVHTLHDKTTNLNETTLHQALTQHRVADSANWRKVNFFPKQVLNCTGAWLPQTGKHYGQTLPIRALRRQISLFSSHEEDFSRYGMVVDSSGLYLHPEGVHSGLVLAGYSNRDEKPGYSFAYDGEDFFNRKIWLRLYRRGGRKHFAALKHVRGWAGLYAVPPDHTGILWKVQGLKNLFELGGATGRGVMQSYALSRAMAELMVQGRFETLDASRLSGARFQKEQWEMENLDI